MTGDYLSIDPTVKEEFWNYHQTHIKHGYFRKWHDNGKLRYQADFENGSTLRPKRIRYDYLTYLPKEYDADLATKWPTIIFLHGGSSRGSDLKRVKANGIPDRIERGKELPFIVIAPQCPIDKRWETDDWFDTLYSEITNRYRIDTSRIYLTGLSLGGSGTWYLAMKHPTTFAAIAPISSKTSHNQFIMDSACKLAGIPIWIFHGKADEIVDVKETYQIAKRLDQCNVAYSLSIFDGHKHWQTQWEVYDEDTIYG